MSLVKRVEKIIEEAAKQEVNRDKALQEAEALADKYAAVRPQTYSVPMEKFLGFPAFSK
jgi:hypothetical protein